MATTEIEKLERRYAENPQGLTFAPLAEVHRKNGDIPRALELLKSGLELHPNYIPASIVLGRCYWDQGDLPAAEAAFSHVLRLDDENVIALKSLAEISERLGRSSEAQRWLKRLITIDRSNEEARQHLAKLEGARAESPAAPSAPAVEPEPAPAAGPKPEEPAPLDPTATIAEPASVEKTEDREETPSPSPALEFLDTSEPPRGAGAAPPTIEPGPIQEELSTADQPAPVDGLISQEFVPPKDSGYRLHPELTQEFGAAAEPVEELEVETAAEVELQSSGAAEFRVPNAAEDFIEAARAPEPPIDLTIQTHPAVPAAPEPTPSPQPAPRLSYSVHSVRETGGQSVAAFFRAMLSARPPGSTAGAATASPGAPQDGKAPATPHQESPQPTEASASVTAPLTPAVPASAPAQDEAVSFDDFFGAAAGGSGAPNSTEPGKDDLDQFQSWLQNLKR